jgi:hypothetical protein
MPFKTDDHNDPNEAYEVVPMKWEPHGPPTSWWTVLCNGIPVWHFAPNSKADADRYATDPEFRKSLVTTKLSDRKPV